MTHLMDRFNHYLTTCVLLAVAGLLTGLGYALHLPGYSHPVVLGTAATLLLVAGITQADKETPRWAVLFVLVAALTTALTLFQDMSSIEVPWSILGPAILTLELLALINVWRNWLQNIITGVG